MAGKRKPKDAPPPDPAPTPAPVAEPPPPRGVPAAVKFLAGLLLAAAVLVALDLVGRRAGLAVAGRDRYAVRTADLRCPAPPGSDRAAFLTEVRYLGDLPDAVSAVDPATPARLSAAFARHPWVAGVTGVTVSPDHAIDVSLTFRAPALAVTVAGESEKRAVDAAGVLLPATAPTAGLAEFANPMIPPPTPAGEPWPDPDVRRAAELAVEFKAARVEKTAKGWRVTEPGGRVLVVGW